MVGFEVSVPAEEPVEAWFAELVEQGYVRAVVGERSETIEPALAREVGGRRAGDDRDGSAGDGRRAAAGAVAGVGGEGVRGGGAGHVWCWWRRWKVCFSEEQTDAGDK